MAQLVGEVQVQECNTCEKEYGPWVECVVVSDSLGLNQSCANCHYGSSGGRCTLRQAANPRSVKKAVQDAFEADGFAQSTIQTTPTPTQHISKKRRIAPTNLSPTPQSRGGNSATSKFTALKRSVMSLY